MFKKTILIDLDGVLNEYTGNYDSEFIPKPKEGAKNFLEEISKSFKLILFTTRDLNKTKEWLIKNEFVKYFSEITNIKKPAWLIIDDRCINFNGNYDKLLVQIQRFKPWYNKVE